MGHKQVKPYRSLYEGSGVDESYMRKFIKENIDKYNRYDIEDIFHNMIQNIFQQETRKYLEFNKYESKWTCSNGFTYTAKSTYEELLKAFKEFEKGSAGNESDEKYHFNFLKGKYPTFKAPNILIIGHQYGMNNLREIIYLLDYVVNGKLEEDYKRANDIYDKYYKDAGGSHALASGPVKIPELGGVEITMYKNGKYVLKGLKPKNYADIERIINMLRGN